MYQNNKIQLAEIFYNKDLRIQVQPYIWHIFNCLCTEVDKYFQKGQLVVGITFDNLIIDLSYGHTGYRYPFIILEVQPDEVISPIKKK